MSNVDEFIPEEDEDALKKIENLAYKWLVLDQAIKKAIAEIKLLQKSEVDIRTKQLPELMAANTTSANLSWTMACELF